MDKYELLRRVYGYEEFRPGQEELIDAVLSRRDVLGIMPTGGGKSMCYQIPGLLLPGLTVAISPLISLMRDQVQALNAAGSEECVPQSLYGQYQDPVCGPGAAGQ